MANEKLFKGIQLVKALPESPVDGVLYLVREHKDGALTGNASVYFGGRKYGEVQSTKLTAIEAAIADNAAAINGIKNTLGEWEIKVGDELATVASAVIAVSGATQTNASDIEDLQTSLAEGGATAEAIAAAKAAADKAQGEVDTLEGVVAENKTELQGNIDKKLAISDFNTYSAATKTAYEKVASDEADAAEAAAKAYVDAISADTRLDALEAISADTRLGALEAISGQSHTHDNKDLLDTYTQTEANLADAVAKKHEHANKTELDKIAEGDKAKWDAAVADIAAFLDENAVSDDVVNTLKEIQEYINGEGAAAEQLLKKISDAQTAADNAQTAADNAQTAVDAIEADYLKSTDKTELQGNIDKKLAISDFNTYSAATKTAYEQAAATAEQNAKDHADGLNTAMDERVDALEAISADTRLEALETSVGENGETTKAIEAAAAAAKAAQDDVDALEKVVETKADATAVTNDIAAATAATYNAATAHTAGEISAVNGTFTAYTAATDSTLSGLRTDVNAVSGATEGLKTSKLDVSAFNTYSASTNTTLQDIQTALKAANAAAVKNVTAADASVVVTGDNDDKKVAVKLSSIEGNMIALKDDGLYAAMYYGGDDVE